MSDASFMSQILQPGGGVLLLPFVRVVVGLLLLTTVSIFVVGVARIHMAILSFLSTGLLISLSVFEHEYKKMQMRNSGSAEYENDNDDDDRDETTNASIKKTD